jgi:GTP-binding protein
VAVNPPTIVLFTNGPDLFDPTYQRYLLKFFRDHLPFREVPIKLHLRAKKKGDELPKVEEDAATPARPAPKRAPKVDLSALDFRSTISDEEVKRAEKRKNDSLWDI